MINVLKLGHISTTTQRDSNAMPLLALFLHVRMENDVRCCTCTTVFSFMTMTYLNTRNLPCRHPESMLDKR